MSESEDNADVDRLERGEYQQLSNFNDSLGIQTETIRKKLLKFFKGSTVAMDKLEDMCRKVQQRPKASAKLRKLRTDVKRTLQSTKDKEQCDILEDIQKVLQGLQKKDFIEVEKFLKTGEQVISSKHAAMGIQKKKFLKSGLYIIESRTLYCALGVQDIYDPEDPEFKLALETVLESTYEFQVKSSNTSFKGKSHFRKKEPWALIAKDVCSKGRTSFYLKMHKVCRLAYMEAAFQEEKNIYDKELTKKATRELKANTRSKRKVPEQVDKIYESVENLANSSLQTAVNLSLHMSKRKKEHEEERNKLLQKLAPK